MPANVGMPCPAIILRGVRRGEPAVGILQPLQIDVPAIRAAGLLFVLRHEPAVPSASEPESLPIGQLKPGSNALRTQPLDPGCNLRIPVPQLLLGLPHR